MSILVISDTHGKIDNVLQIIKNNKNIDLIIHLGDLVRDAETLEIIEEIKIEYIAGNCDFISKYPKEKIIEYKNKRIFLTHGHQYNVKWEYSTIKKTGKRQNADIVLFGHTHIPYLDEDEIILMNPGSISSPRGGNKLSYGIISIDNSNNIQAIIESFIK
ncbi:hypothetical protein EDC18_11457 [Natranaerovirga pectinivora]|uniref:Phosphoesterase n=1 Tax=Natranaerovirga pectinivora TaxID=682400 RepID=A0A4R3MF74_9FIRM|nr:metallophosphoesterase [Natranaerovirga pectinivora]TCT12151.1 hypothetical protein EDC18_11457 [Natranaerovirga pectinivora]